MSAVDDDDLKALAGTRDFIPIVPMNDWRPVTRTMIRTPRGGERPKHDGESGLRVVEHASRLDRAPAVFAIADRATAEVGFESSPPSTRRTPTEHAAVD